MSITEISHRSKWFDDVINGAVERVQRILKLDARYRVLFLQGGASMQFCMIPMNFLADGKKADYVNTGTWSTKAIKEAQIQGNLVWGISMALHERLVLENGIVGNDNFDSYAIARNSDTPAMHIRQLDSRLAPSGAGEAAFAPAAAAIVNAFASLDGTRTRQLPLNAG